MTAVATRTLTMPLEKSITSLIFFCERCGFRIPTAQAFQYQHLPVDSTRPICAICQTAPRNAISSNSPSVKNKKTQAVRTPKAIPIPVAPQVRRNLPVAASSGQNALLLYIGPALGVLVLCGVVFIFKNSGTSLKPELALASSKSSVAESKSRTDPPDTSAPTAALPVLLPVWTPAATPNPVAAAPIPMAMPAAKAAPMATDGRAEKAVEAEKGSGSATANYRALPVADDSSPKEAYAKRLREGKVTPELPESPKPEENEPTGTTIPAVVESPAAAAASPFEVPVASAPATPKNPFTLEDALNSGASNVGRDVSVALEASQWNQTKGAWKFENGEMVTTETTKERGAGIATKASFGNNIDIQMSLCMENTKYCQLTLWNGGLTLPLTWPSDGTPWRTLNVTCRNGVVKATLGTHSVAGQVNSSSSSGIFNFYVSTSGTLHVKDLHFTSY